MLTEEISSFVHFGNKEFDISSKFMKVSIFLHLLGDFSPVCMQSVYPRCTCAVPSACNITNIQKMVQLLQIVPKVKMNISVYLH